MSTATIEFQDVSKAFSVESERLVRGLIHDLNARPDVLGIIVRQGALRDQGKSLEFILYQVYLDGRHQHERTEQEIGKICHAAGFSNPPIAVDEHGNKIVMLWLKPGRRGPQPWTPQQ